MSHCYLRTRLNTALSHAEASNLNANDEINWTATPFARYLPLLVMLHAFTHLARAGLNVSQITKFNLTFIIWRQFRHLNYRKRAMKTDRRRFGRYRNIISEIWAVFIVCLLHALGVRFRTLSWAQKIQRKMIERLLNDELEEMLLWHFFVGTEKTHEELQDICSRGRKVRAKSSM
jgi:hypothetical protein